MNELLISELHAEETSLLQKIILIEDFIFTRNDTRLIEFDAIVEQCQTVVNDFDEDDPLGQAELLINELYINQLLLDNPAVFWPISAHQIGESLASRNIAPTLKAILLRTIIERCNFDCDIVFIPNKTMIRLVCDDIYAIIFDPVTGESLNWQEFDHRMDELDDPSQYQPEELSHNQLIIQHLTSLKNTLIRDRCFDQALKCVDILLKLQPDDPLQRRDRGFLLQQLDCFKVAVDDYRYFVQQCPKDPAAQLLKMQLDNITISETTLH